MASTPAVCSVNEVQGLRKAPTFHPSLWGDFFATFQPPTAHQRAYMAERAEVLKEQVRKMLKGANEVPKILDLVITLQRLGLDSHYENEMDELLNFVYNSDYDDKDLNLVSLRFYLLRKNGYDVSSDVFLNFKDKEGNFVADDIKSLLSLYNAAYLRTHGEEVLDEAIIFTRGQLKAALDSLESTLADEISLALQTPLFRRVRILETRNYIPIYEREAARNEAILEFAKFNFNLLQLLYCEELKQITLIVEMHFWMTGACPEPKYSLSRVILTKMTAYITILDDIMDTYSTTEEAMLLAEAIYRCEANAIELLPGYMKDFYLHLLKTFDSCEDELGPNKSYRVFYLKELLKMLVRGYSQEIKWRDEHYVPETINEHLELSGVTVGVFQLVCSSLVGMGDIITKEILDWLLTYPGLLKCLSTFARLSNDIASIKREQIGGHHASTVQCYMLQHGTTMHDACEKIKELIEDSWKDMKKFYLTPTEQPKVVAQTVVDFARTGDYMYKKTDAFTFSHTIKDMIGLLYVEPLF
ncbi:beta-sesquiphellandrene synthase-like isoform X2 [Phragmites australis]|uniref:beta-sesquiphellandrene synthase-like isoform X2 n=1 Tax=Phragmites australis TaxID=29695 RepID=UPI002D768A77|nr:beta-sesquiphellandrene synthase-like isoform X2 [Phragmites australis]